MDQQASHARDLELLREDLEDAYDAVKKGYATEDQLRLIAWHEGSDKRRMA